MFIVLMDVSDLFDEEKKVDPFEKEDEIQSAIESAVPSPQPGRTDTSSATINHNQKDLSSTVKPPFCPLLKPLEKSYTLSPCNKPLSDDLAIDFWQTALCVVPKVCCWHRTNLTKSIYMHPCNPA